MAIKITGLGDLQRDLGQASQALEALRGQLTTVKFDPNDPSSVDLAIADVEAAIDAKVASFRGNAIVEQFVEGIKKQYRTELLDRASAQRLKRGATSMASTNIDPTTLRQIENVVSDLRNSEYQSFGKHLKKLSRLLHSPELEPATARLIKDIDLEGWLKAGEDTQGGMIGSAKLEWPSEHEKELGTVVLLIDRFADNPDEALNSPTPFTIPATISPRTFRIWHDKSSCPSPETILTTLNARRALWSQHCCLFAVGQPHGKSLWSMVTTTARERLWRGIWRNWGLRL